MDQRSMKNSIDIYFESFDKINLVQMVDCTTS